MAKTLLLLLLSLLSLTFSSAGRILSVDNEVPDRRSTFTHVCDPARLRHRGLDMSMFAFCNKSIPFEFRAKDLVGRMTLAEKVRQISNAAWGVSRLGLPEYQWWSEALHGVSNEGPRTRFDDDVVPGATSFPTVIVTTASFNETLWKTIGQVVSTEARAMYNLGLAGLTFWSPNINIVRDPRWGRIQETPGEDPFVVGTYAANYVRGLQDVEGTENITDPNSRPLKISASCKHYAAYDLDNWLTMTRYTFDAKVTEQDMIETFVKPFEMCVKDGDVSSVMCSYNKVNGIPACADPRLLKGVIRGEWDLHGYIVSDCDSVQVMVDDHKFLGDSGEDGVAQAIKAGMDLDCGDFYSSYSKNAVEEGKVAEGDIDESLKNLYVVLMRVGFFDGSPAYESLGKDDVCSKEHIELATEAARQGIVLLKNDNETLPLRSNKIKTLGLIGPHANASDAMIGNYRGIPCQITSPLDAFSKYATVKYKSGCPDVLCNHSDHTIFEAMKVAKQTDATILFVGLDASMEQECLDRVHLHLPGQQQQLIEQVAEVSQGPVVLVIMSAGGVDVSFAKGNNKIKAILWAGYPGQEGGQAIADVIFGKYNPGGKLPITWYKSEYVDMLPMTSMAFRPIDSLGYPGRTHRFFNGSTVYPFGYGLSYTNFIYKLFRAPNTLIHVYLNKFHHTRGLTYNNDIDYKPSDRAMLTDDLECNESFEFEVRVENVGPMDGSEVIMVYSKPPSGISNTHIRQLIGFKKVFVRKGNSENVKFSFNVCKSLGIVDYNAYTLLPSGSHTIVLGDDVVSFSVGVEFIR